MRLFTDLLKFMVSQTREANKRLQGGGNKSICGSGGRRSSFLARFLLLSFCDFLRRRQSHRPRGLSQPYRVSAVLNRFSLTARRCAEIIGAWGLSSPRHVSWSAPRLGLWSRPSAQAGRRQPPTANLTI